ncbi:MAG TPA: ABC transporter substrate-binding protein [Vicinamibacterales bacterium]|nr:ABC transporter substrate-binding protein [Vicinamibacterales bacterium]
MDRRRFLSLTAALLAAPLAAEAQQPGKVPRIGYLSSSSATSTSRFVDAFRQGLRELGWLEGQNIVIDWRFADGRFDRLPDLAAELVRLKVQVIVAAPTPAVVTAKNATATIPIVMINVSDPVGLGLVTSLARPGGNATGVSYSVGVENFGKALELLKESIPNIRRVAVLSNPASAARAPLIRDVGIAARSLGLQLQHLEAQDPNDFDAAFATMAKERVEALLVAADSMFIIHRARLAELAAENRLPAIYGIREHVDAGGLMSYGPSTVANYRRAAFFVDKILKGAQPGDLPVEQPTKFELVINLRTAKALGLTMPPSLLLRADEVIE